MNSIAVAQALPVLSLQHQHQHQHAQVGRPRKRQRTGSVASLAGLSPATTSSTADGSPHARSFSNGNAALEVGTSPNGSTGEKTVVKRACNECRQQKLRCDVVQDPYTVCTRCNKLKLDCRIDTNFKRTVKRSKIAEMEKELAYLRQKLGMPDTASPASIPQFSPRGQISQPLLDASASAITSFHQTTQPVTHANGEGPNTTEPTGAKRGRPKADAKTDPLPEGSRRLGDVTLSKVQIASLFQQYFDHYHPFLPLLAPETPPSVFYNQSQLLFWVIISIASRRFIEEPTLLLRLSRSVSKLVWDNLNAIPHAKDVVKALVLLMTWPFPTSSTMTDPSYLLTNMAISVAVQMGLHRPGYGKDYTKFANTVKIEEKEIGDRTNTWACCNISAQSVSTGLGLPPNTQYDWTLSNALSPSSKFPLSPPIRSLLLIQRFADEVTRAMTSNSLDPIGLLSPDARSSVVSVLERQADELEGELSPMSSIHNIYMTSARLHLRSFHLFDPPTTINYQSRILSLFTTASEFVHLLQADELLILPYCPFYIYQMLTLSSFVILKVLHSSSLRTHIDYDAGRVLFNTTITYIRRMSVANNDLPGRLADVLVQLWGCGQVGDGELRIRSRMSVSVVYDSLWKWREEFTTRSAFLQSREELGAEIPPPDVSAPSISSKDTDMGWIDLEQDGMGNLLNMEYSPLLDTDFSNLNWMLDGFEFLAPGIEDAGGFINIGGV